MRTLLLALLLAGCANGRSTVQGDAGAPDGPPASADAPRPPADAAPADAPGADANGCATQPCDIATQCGCGATQACDLNFATLMGTACRGVFSPGREGNACTSVADCDRGFVCLGNGAGASSCKKYCATNADCAQPRGQCVIDLQSGGSPIPGAPPVCSSNCDPTSATAAGCPAGWKCDLYTQTHNGTSHPIVDCTSAVGAGTQGASCQAASGTGGDDSKCAAGFLCTTADGTSFKCRKMCNVTANTGCTALTCLGLATPHLVGGTEYGVCN